MPAGGRGNASDKGKDRGCSPCCTKTLAEESPPLQPAPKTLYTGNVMKPTQGTLPSSKAGFLVSFLVDARGGAMTGHRHWGMRVIIPPAAVQQPTRINCRYQQLTSLPFPPPFMEREALASRVIEVSPAGETFRSPVLIEIPHFASNAGAEREIIVLRSDDGETWYEHVSDEVENGEIYQDVVTSVVMKDSDLERIYDVLEVTKGRIIRILTSKFPKYFAVLTRVREEVKSVGPDGGKVVLLHEPRLRATFPKNALYKKIKVGLQVQSLKPELVQAAFGRSVEVSKMIALEPRKRKFHQPIFISIPLPCSPSKINPSTSIRLLCSVTGATDKAVWADLTGTTPLELCKDVVHFSTKVSAIFWILVIHDKQRDPESALTLASRLYEESILIPYLARFSIFYRENFPRAWVNTIRVYCMTDDKAEKVIKSLQGFRPLAISGDVEVSHTSSISVKLSGNVIQLRQDPFTGEFLAVSSIRTNEVKEPFVFKAFEDNSMTILVQPKDLEKPLSGCLSFGRRLDHISATQQLPLCEMRFDVSGGDTNFVIKEDMTFETLDAGVNGHTPDIIDAPPPMPTFRTIEEEDPYEKIEIKKNKEGVADIKKPQETQKQSTEKPKGKKDKQQSVQKSEVKESSKSKQTSQTSTTTTINQSTKTSSTKTGQEKTVEKKDLKSEVPQVKEKKPQVQSINVKAGICVHDVKISDFCNKCSEEQKSFERSASTVPQEDTSKGREKDKQINNEGGSQIKTEIKDNTDSKTALSKKPKAEKIDTSCNSCVHDIALKDFCKCCTDNQKSLDRRSSKKPKENKDDTLEQSLKKEEKNIEVEKIETKKEQTKKTKEIALNDESKAIKKQSTKKTKEGEPARENSGKKAEENQQINEEALVNKSLEKEENEKNIKKKNEDNKTKLDDQNTKADNSRKKSDKKSMVSTGPKSCVHSVPLSETCQLCEDNQKSLSRKGTKATETISKQITKESNKDVEHVSVIKQDEKINKSVKENSTVLKKPEETHFEAKAVEKKGPEICIHDIPILDRCKSCEENQRSLIIETPKISEESDGKREKKKGKKALDVKELKDAEDVHVAVSKEVFHNLDTGVKLCIHDVLIEDFCQTCSESQVKAGLEKCTDESEGKITKKSTDVDVANIQEKTERTKKDSKKKDLKSLSTQLCIHDVAISEPCEGCKNSETVPQSLTTDSLQRVRESKTKNELKSTDEYETTAFEKKEMDKSEIGMKIPQEVTTQEIKEKDAYKKDASKKRDNSKSRKKTQEFKPNDLEALRDEFAKNQGVKEIKDISTSQTKNKQADTHISQLEEKSVSPNVPANKTQAIKETVDTTIVREQLCIHDISIAELCQKCDESEAHNTLQNYLPVKEERKKKGRKSKEIQEAESLYEPVGKGNEAISLEVAKNQTNVDEVFIEEKQLEDTNKNEISEEKDNKGISGIADDFKDFSSLKRKKKEKSVKTEPFIENVQIGEFDQSNQNKDNVVLHDADFQRRDDVIGFDININNDNTNPFVTEEEFEEIELSKEKDRTNEQESPVTIIPPPLPARLKHSKQLSSSDSTQNVSVSSEQKEKKTSFIKEWQKDLKEFFSLGKKKKRDISLSRGSSSKRSDSDSRQGDFNKYDKNHEASKEQNISKGNNDRFSSFPDTENRDGQTKTKEKSSKDEEIYGYTKDPSGKDVDADKPAEIETEHISTKGDGMQEAAAVDESVERRKKKRRDRRKTNSESSCTKVEIPAYPADDKVSSNTCVHDIPLADVCKTCSDNQKSLNRISSKKQTATKESPVEKDEKLQVEQGLESKTAANKSPKAKKISAQKCIHDIIITDLCKECDANEKSVERKESKKPSGKNEVETDNNRTGKVDYIEERKPMTNKSPKAKKFEMSSQKCIHDINISDLCNDCDDNQKSLDRRASKKPTEKMPIKNQSNSANKDAQEDPPNLVQRRNKKKDKKADAESKMDDNNLSIGGKPKIIVPSPQGIPRPKPINKRDTNRDSMLSDDGVFFEDNMKTEGTGSLEETEEFRKAVESFDQIYLLESGNQSPEITSSRSSTLSKKLAKSNEDPKPEASPIAQWKRLKTGRSFDATETISSESQSHSQVTEFSSQSSEMKSSERKFQHQDSSRFIESKSVECTESSTVKTQKSSKQITEDMRIETANVDNSNKQSTEHFQQEERFGAENHFQSGLSQSKIQSQSQSYQSSTVEEKQLSKKMLKKGKSIESTESSKHQLSASESIQKQESLEVYENNRINQEHKLESSQVSKSSKNMLIKGTSIESSESSEHQSSASDNIQKQESLEVYENRINQEQKLESSHSSKSSKSSKKNKKNRQSTEVEEKNNRNVEETKAQEINVSSSKVPSSQPIETGNKKIKKGKSIDLPEKSDESTPMYVKSDTSVESPQTESMLMENQSTNNAQDRGPTKGESKKSSKKNKKGKSLELQEKSDESPAMSVKSNISVESPQTGTNLMQTEPSNNVQTTDPTKSESKKSSKKGKNCKSLDLEDKKDESPVMSVKSEMSSNSSNVELRKSSGNSSKHDSWIEIEQAYEGSLPVPVPVQTEVSNVVQTNSEVKKSSKKNKKGKSIDLPESDDFQVNKLETMSATGMQDNMSNEENLEMETERSRKISILGRSYVDTNQNTNDSSDFHEEVIKETTTWKKESKGFLSDEEREELEKENALVKAIREFQAQSSNESTHSEVSSHVLSDVDFSDEVKYSELEKQIIQKSMDAQETIKTALYDIEKTSPSLQNQHTKQETVKVQKHSLSIQDGVLVEQTTTERFSQPSDCLESQSDSCTIDPESLKNVDGLAKQRKGSSRFSKRQGSKSKSPGLGNQSSFSGPDDREEAEETMNNTDLTTRLEETNVRMKKLSEVFNVMCDDPRVEPSQEMEEDERAMKEENIMSFEAEGRQTSYHPLTRTTQIIRKECPLDEVIGTMIQKPENLSSSSQFSSSVENSPLMYRAVVVHQSREENNSASPLMYRAVVTQRHEEREEFQEEDLL